MSLEIAANVKHGLADLLGMPEMEWHDHSAQPTIAIGKGMNCFELRVKNGDLDKPVLGF